MGKFLSAVGVWFAGKKTILGGVIVMGAAVAGLWFGKVDPVTGVTIFGAGLTMAGAGAKANRHQAELLTALKGVAQAGADYRAGKPGQALKDAEATAQDLVPGIAVAALSQAPGLQISGATAADVVAIARGFAGQTTVISNGQGNSPVDQIASAVTKITQQQAAAR